MDDAKWLSLSYGTPILSVTVSSSTSKKAVCILAAGDVAIADEYFRFENMGAVGSLHVSDMIKTNIVESTTCHTNYTGNSGVHTLWYDPRIGLRPTKTSNLHLPSLPVAARQRLNQRPHLVAAVLHTNTVTSWLQDGKDLVEMSALTHHHKRNRIASTSMRQTKMSAQWQFK